MDDFIRTIEDDDEVQVADESSNSEDEGTQVTKKKKKRPGISNRTRAAEFSDDFDFVDVDDNFDRWTVDMGLLAKKKNETTTLDEKIAKLRRRRKDVETGEQDSGGEEEDMEVEEVEEEEPKRDTLRTKEKKKKKKKNVDPEEELITYSQEIDTFDDQLTFTDMNLSRPLMKAISSAGYTHPTPIQAATIPVALLGKDLCACAATGTGKTAAFMLPVLERLLYKPVEAAHTRVLVLTPTRELAVQIHQVSRQLAQHTKIDVCISAGGLDIKSQEAALRLGPDIVVATPGRLIDHLQNTPSFSLDRVEILILDEADRMLDEYFAEQMKEVMRMCSRTRQTMLFSATMTEQVKELAAVSLTNPVKIFVNENTDVALNLKQEFIRIRAKGEGDREAIIAALVTRTFHDHVIVFIQTKVQAHRMHVLLGLLGVQVAELHGNLSQAQRLESLEKFKEGEVDVLLATDVAARGLDIQGVKTIINFTMPNTIKSYIHRVGRTARAGKSGRAVTLVGENERRFLKDVVKRATVPVKSRIIPGEVVQKFRDRITRLEADVAEVTRLELEEKELRISELQIKKVEKKLNNDKDSDPKRTWFQTKQQREKEKAGLCLGTYMTPAEKRKGKKGKKAGPLTAEDRVQYDIDKASAYYVRTVKKDAREKRKRVFEDDDGGPVAKKAKKGGKAKAAGKVKSSFERELTNTSKKAVKMMRAGPSYEEKKAMGKTGAKPFKSKGGNKGKRYKKR